MKKILALTLVLALALSLAACGGGGGAGNIMNDLTNPQNTADDGTNSGAADNGASAADNSAGTDSDSGNIFSTQDEISAKLTNYDLTLKTVNSDGSSSLSRELYVKDEALISMSDEGSATYFDYKNNQSYVLDTDDMTGSSWGAASDYGGGGIILSILVNFGLVQSTLLENDLFAVQKVGADTVAGISTTVYAYTFGGAAIKFWIDDQYGLALKVESDSTNWEVTSLRVGGVNPSDWINLSDYTIQ